MNFTCATFGRSGARSNSTHIRDVSVFTKICRQHRPRFTEQFLIRSNRENISWISV